MTVFLDVEDDACACGASLVECPFCGAFCADACAASSGPCPHWAEMVTRADAASGAPAYGVDSAPSLGLGRGLALPTFPAKLAAWNAALAP